MKSTRVVKTQPSRWPPRPPGELFPEVITTVDVAQLLRYDARDGMTPEKGARMVRLLVRDRGLPTLGRVGRTLLFRKSEVIGWLDTRRNGQKTGGAQDTVSDARCVSPDEIRSS